MTLAAGDARVDLDADGPGAELVAHLQPVLQDLIARPMGSRPGPEGLLHLLDAQARSRWLDVAARRLRAGGRGHYTIASAGHEGNAAVALAARTDDPALLHYRSGAFYLARAAQALHPTGLADIALGLVAAAADPISGGRHKVIGHPRLAVIPQTSTAASHLPRALGVAWAIGRQSTTRGRVPVRWPADAVVVAGFGDASANHSTAAGAVNAACWAVRRGAAIPLLLVCEDNGWGISVPTPPGWIRSIYSGREHLHYRFADGADPVSLLAAAEQAVHLARTEREPVLLHLACVRIGGHAGTDVESGYRDAGDIAADLERDPLAATMRAVVDGGLLDGVAVAGRFLAARDEVAEVVAGVQDSPPLRSRTDVMAPIAPRRPDLVAARAAREPPERSAVFGTRPEDEGPLTLAQTVNRALLDAAAGTPELVVLGQDVARKGGVYGVTRGLRRRLGAGRVVDTLLDEQSVLGLALGAATSGLLPVPEIQYLAFLHNAEDQLRGEAASLQFFSNGGFRNPMVVRVPGLAYQRGFGGHFHNDNSVAVLRDIPGLVVACPAHPSDAAALLRTCLAAAEVDGTVSVLLEPIALYHERDMITEGDGAWMAPYPAPPTWGMAHVPIGRATVWLSGTDLTIATFGNGLRLSLRAAATLAAEGIGCRVVDLRWLAPLPIADVLREARVSGRLLIVDETRRSGGVSEGLVTGLLESGFTGRLARVVAADSFVPLGDAAELVLVSQAEVEHAARQLVR